MIFGWGLHSVWGVNNAVEWSPTRTRSTSRTPRSRVFSCSALIPQTIQLLVAIWGISVTVFVVNFVIGDLAHRAHLAGDAEETRAILRAPVRVRPPG